MKMHTNPIASDGQWTIGYDDNGMAGEWPGNWAETCETENFEKASRDQEFVAIDQDWYTIKYDDGLAWETEGEYLSRLEALQLYRAQ